MKEIILEIQKRYAKVLEAKTGLGKNEVKAAFDQVVIEVLAEFAGEYV